MKTDQLIRDLKRELKRYAETDYQAAQQWFFKEKIVLMGVRVGRVRMIGNQFYRQIKGQLKVDILAVAEEMMKIDLQEFRIIAIQWARKQTKQFTPSDFVWLERWVAKYVTNWAICDGVSAWLVGELLRQHPSLVKKTVAWRYASNRWMRRSAAVSLIPTVETKKNLIAVFACADDLLADEDDMVQKGYGWLLKEVSNSYPNEVFAYVQKRKATMPRTALRYAIEKLPASKRQQAMSK